MPCCLSSVVKYSKCFKTSDHCWRPVGSFRKAFSMGWPHIFRLEFHEHAPHDRLWSQNPSQNTWEHSLHIRSPGFSARARALIGRGAEGPEGLGGLSPTGPAAFPTIPGGGAAAPVPRRASPAAPSRPGWSFGRCRESGECPPSLAGAGVRPFPARRTSASSAVACRKWLPAGRGSGGSCAAWKAGGGRRERLWGT